MKRRRLIISLFLIAAVALLGIGYSAITTRLDIRGSVSSKASTNDFDVEFVGAELGSIADGVVCAPSFDTTTGVDATLNISGLSNNGQKVVAYFKVQNNSKAISSLNAELKDLTIVITNNDKQVTDKNTTDTNVFVGNYIQVEAVFVDEVTYISGQTNTTDTSTGKIGEKGLTATVNTAVEGEKAAVAQYVWIQVTVTVIGSFTSETTHGINIHFNAVSIDLTPTNE